MPPALHINIPTRDQAVTSTGSTLTAVAIRGDSQTEEEGDEPHKRIMRKSCWLPHQGRSAAIFSAHYQGRRQRHRAPPVQQGSPRATSSIAVEGFAPAEFAVHGGIGGDVWLPWVPGSVDEIDVVEYAEAVKADEAERKAREEEEAEKKRSEEEAAKKREEEAAEKMYAAIRAARLKLPTKQRPWSVN